MKVPNFLQIILGGSWGPPEAEKSVVCISLLLVDVCEIFFLVLGLVRVALGVISFVEDGLGYGCGGVGGVVVVVCVRG